MSVRGVGGGIRFPFTAAQWHELEQQALIFKYMLSGVPVPTHFLLATVRRRRRSSSSFGDFAHPTPLPSSSQSGWRRLEVGRKIDPEPGRCRRTDGKKWRCSKEALQDYKYCEKHRHRGKNRSRKPVEHQQQVTINTPSSSLMSDNDRLCHPPAYTKLLDSTTTHLALDSASSHHRYSNSNHRRPSMMEDDNAWHLTPLAMRSRKTLRHPYLDADTSCSKLGQGRHPTVFKFLEEGPIEKKDSCSSWLNLDDKSSTTQLSISIPAAAATSHHHAFPIFNNSRLSSHPSQTSD